MTYSLEEYFILFSVKKLIYFHIFDDSSKPYCHECCMKRLVFLKGEMPNLVFSIINGKERKIINLT